MKIIMTDQDGVVVDSSYQTTCDTSNLIKNTLSNNCLLIPNSDTPVQRLINNFIDLLDFDAQIVIGEKGAIIWLDGKFFFTSQVNGIKNYLSQLANTFREIGVMVIIGDSATWIKAKKTFEPNKKMVIIDGFRQQSICFYIRKTDSNGLPIIDEDWYYEGLEIVNQLPLPEGLEDNDRNIKYGIVIMNSAGVNKTTGYRFLKKKFPRANFFMIGDSNSDIISDESVVHCAVANATPEFMAQSKFIANQKFTNGLAECLLWISRQ